MNSITFSAAEANKYYQDIRNKILPPKKAFIRLAIVSSATVEPFLPGLYAYAYTNDLSLDVYVAPFNQVQQSVFSAESLLYQEERDVVILDLDLRTFYPPLGLDLLNLNMEDRQQHATLLLGEIQSILDQLSAKTQAMICLNNFFIPQVKELGLNSANPHSIKHFWLKFELALDELASRYPNVILIDQAGYMAKLGQKNWYDPKFYYLAGMTAGSQATTWWSLPYIPIFRELKGLRKKCLILDLDHTLWGGIIGEDGLSGIKIGGGFPGNAFQDFQRQCLALYHQGIILALCSKNNLEDVKAVFEEHPEMILKWKHFAVHRVNWDDKVSNIKEIARILNIGIDSLVFMDDNPAECEHVKMGLPEVSVVQVTKDPAQLPGLLQSLSLFDTMHISRDDQVRNSTYVMQAERANAEATAGSLEGFLKSLGMKAKIELLDAHTLTRSAQLLQKTNQFNLTTRRHSMQFLQKIIESKNWFGYAVFLADKFGDYGQIGLLLVEIIEDTARIDTFLMSCRVMGRTLEFELLEYLKQKLPVSVLLGEYIQTSKNRPVSNFYLDCGFQAIKSEGEVLRYVFDLNQVNVHSFSKGFVELDTVLLDSQDQ